MDAKRPQHPLSPKNRQWDVLVIGLPESGKDSFLKQVKLSYRYKNDAPLRREYLYPVCCIIHCMLKKVGGHEMDTGPVQELLTMCRQRFENGYKNGRYEREMQLLALLLRLWEKLTNKKQADDVAGTAALTAKERYFWRRLPQIVAQPDSYLPTADDIMHTENETVYRVQEFNFHEHGLKMRLVVIGNQETNWRKYIHYFESAFAVIFIADTSSFDKTPRNLDYANRFEETLAFFQDISYTKWLESAKLFLVLNKLDDLEAKLSCSACDFRPTKENAASKVPTTKNVTASMSAATSRFLADYVPAAGIEVKTALKAYVQEKFHKVDHRFQSSGSSCYLFASTMESSDVQNVMQMVTEWPLSSVALGSLLRHS